MISKEDLETFWISTYPLDKSDSSKNIYFLEGFLLGKNDKNLEKNIRLYLIKVYDIDDNYFTFLEMVEYYAFIKNNNLIDALYTLLNEVNNFNFETINSQGTHFKSSYKYFKPETRLVGKKVESKFIGRDDYVFLNDKIGECYKKNKFFDKNLKNSSWELFYPSDRSDFKFINFYSAQDPSDYSGSNDYSNIQNVKKYTLLDPLFRIFSGTYSKVKEIVEENGVLIVYTDLFRIELENALEENEITIISKENVEINDFSDLIEKINLYMIGFSGYPIMSELIGTWCFSNLHKFKKKWYNYYRNINGKWFSIKKS